MIGLQDPPTSGITSGPCCAMAMATDGQVPLRGVAGHAVCNRSRCARRQEMAEQEPLRGVAGHAVCNRSRCARRQEMAEQEPLCLVAGDTATGGRSRFLGGSWCCAGRQEPLRSRCGGCQETLHRAAGAAPGGRAAGDAALGDSGETPAGEDLKVLHTRRPRVGVLRCGAFGVPRRTRMWFVPGASGRCWPRHTPHLGGRRCGVSQRGSLRITSSWAVHGSGCGQGGVANW